MKAGGGKQKGSQFERDICKALSLWVSGDKQEDLFWRSAMSGGRSTVHHRKGKFMGQHAGDITSTSPEGHKLTDYFFVECKFVADLGLAGFVLNTGSTMMRFWEIACKEAGKYNRAPMIIAKQNRSPIFVAIDSRDAKGFNWAKESALARIATGPETSCTIVAWEQMLKQPFSMRWRY